MLSWINDLGPQDPELLSDEKAHIRRSSHELVRSFPEGGTIRRTRLKSFSIQSGGFSNQQHPVADQAVTTHGKEASIPKEPVSTRSTATPEPSIEDIDLIDDLIVKLQEVILLNRHHVGAHVMLGVLYYFREKYDIALKYLLQICHSQKGRGSEFGRNGMASFAGGVSGRWSQISWRFVSRCFLKKGGIEMSKTAVIRALKERQAARIRCMESLRRVF